LLSVFSVVPGGDAQALSYAVVVHLVFYATTTIWGVLAFMRYGFESLKVVTMAWEAQPLKTLPEESLSTMKVISLLPEQQVKGSAVSPFLFSLTEAFIPPQYPAMDPVSRHEAFERASEFVSGQLAALPWLLKFPLAMGLNCFRVCVWLKTFSDFTALPVGQRHQLIRAYAFDGNGFWRKLFRPVRSICVLAFFEDESVKAALDNKNNRAASSLGAKNA
jgi:hypothetical protein